MLGGGLTPAQHTDVFTAVLYTGCLKLSKGCFAFGLLSPSSTESVRIVASTGCVTEAVIPYSVVGRWCPVSMERSNQQHTASGACYVPCSFYISIFTNFSYGMQVWHDSEEPIEHVCCGDRMLCIA